MYVPEWSEDIYTIDKNIGITKLQSIMLLT